MLALRTISLLSLVMASAPSAAAQVRSNPFSYNYLQVDYVNTKYELVLPGNPVVDDVDGWGARFSIVSDSDVRIVGSWHDMKGQGNTRRDGEVGLGFISHLSNRMDSKLDLKYLKSETKSGEYYSDTQEGYGIEGGVRALLTDRIEMDLTAEFRDLYGTELGGHGGLLFRVSEVIGIEAYYTYFETQQTYRGGVRVSF